MITNACPDKQHRFKRSNSFDRQRLTAHEEWDACVACLTFVWHFESAPLWSLLTNHNVGRFEPRRGEKWCAHQWWKKSVLIVPCDFRVMGLASGLGNTVVEIAITRCQRRGWWMESCSIVDNEGGNTRNTFVSPRCAPGFRKPCRVNLSRARIASVSSLKSSKFKIEDYCNYCNFSNLRSFPEQSSSGSQRAAE